MSFFRRHKITESLQLITNWLLEEAKKNAEETTQEAQKSAEAMLEKQRLLGIQKANELTQSILRKAEDEAEIYKSRIIAEAKIKANWTDLSKKELWITNVLNETRNKLKALPQTKKYIRIIEKLIIEAGVMLGGNELEVLLNEQDSNLNLKFDKLAKLIGEKTDSETKLKLSIKKANIIGGVIVKTSDGKIVMDNSFEDILKRREKDLRAKIAKILFD